METFELPVQVRLASVEEQIGEIRKMLWRNILEARIEKETNAGDNVQAEAAYNNKKLSAKLKILLTVHKELVDEAGSSPTVQGPAV